MIFRLTLMSVALMLPLLLSSCSWIQGNKTKSQHKNEIQPMNSQFKCLEQVDLSLKNFATGNGQEKQIRESMQCLSSALVYFSQRTTGSLPDGYAIEDLRKFFGKYFLKKNNISSEFAGNLFKLKKALIGGQETELTKEELKRTIQILQVLENEMVALSPHISVLFDFNKAGAPQIQSAQVVTAIKQLEASALNFLNHVDLKESDYSFEDLRTLFWDLYSFVSFDKKVPLFEQTLNYVPLITSLKNILFGESAHFINSADWNTAVKTTVGLYEIFLQYQYFIKNNLLASPAQIEMGLEFSLKSITLLMNSHQMREKGKIPFILFERLIDDLYSSVIGLNFATSEVMKKTARQMIFGLFDPVRKGDLRGASDLERQHLKAIYEEFLNVIAQQKLIHQQLNIPVTRLNEMIKSEPATFDLQSFKRVIFESRLVQYDEKGRVLITQNKSNEQSWKTLTRMNVMYTLTRLFMFGYGDHKDPQLARVSERSLDQWYTDFAPLGVKIKAFDPRSMKPGYRSHKEANLFTSKGNGDEHADFNEMYELISLIFSAGLQNTQQARLVFEKSKCAVNQKDIFDFYWLNQECTNRSLYENYQEIFANLPGLQQEISKMNQVEWDQFSSALWKAAKSPTSPDGFLETADLRTAVMILHYIESLYVVFDKNLDQRLDVNEIRAAAPRFMNLLKSIAPTQNDKILTEGFVALVYQGKKPDASSLVGFQWDRFLDWLDYRRLGYAQRANLMNVFANLKNDLAGSPQSNIK